ncbi:PREDICTED: uncharacterized protein LOC104756247 [Camelina sativa]|uniref:Uncharacterized protein LOC104756247 n=1 Tax=Camelina sativa TaxID=90675 RepID=A0ABM0WWC8_CAMSA|nr:PREDICTED: uncharacterized protein LOC104756247 [Camelina sativa]
MSFYMAAKISLFPIVAVASMKAEWSSREKCSGSAGRVYRAALQAVVASISAGNEERKGTMIVDAIDKVGCDGSLSIESSYPLLRPWSSRSGNGE